MKTPVKLLALGAAASALLVPAGTARAQTLITGNDEKVWFDETGKTVNQPPVSYTHLTLPTILLV